MSRIAVLLALAALGCGGTADPAPPPVDVAESLVAYDKLDGNCSADDFELEAFSVPVWLTVWPCDAVELGPGRAVIECWDPAVITGPRLTVTHEWAHAAGYAAGSAVFAGPTCAGRYATRYR